MARGPAGSTAGGPARGTAPPEKPTPGGSPGTALLPLPVRALLVVVGSAALGLGIVGIFVPVLPTTPFLLVAAACYARSSDRLYTWLLGQPSLGRIVSEWRRSRSLPVGVKPRALLVVAVTFAISILVVDSLAVRLGLAAVALVLAWFLWRIPEAGRA
jgi:hypothetical protein